MICADLQHLFRVHKSTLSKFIPQVYQAIYNQLKEEHRKVTYNFLLILILFLFNFSASKVTNATFCKKSQAVGQVMEVASWFFE